MAAATQQAPQQTPRAARTGMASPKRAKQADVKQGNALQNLSQGAGIAIMAVLLAASLFVGNFRALSSATPQAFIRQGDVASILEDYAAQAQNAMTVARRANLSENVYYAVDEACRALRSAKTAKEISRANQQLQTAVANMVDAAAGLSQQDERMLTQALDSFNEEGSFLRQEARSYNERAKKAEKVYESLPTKFVLPQPDVYEGL